MDSASSVRQFEKVRRVVEQLGSESARVDSLFHTMMPCFSSPGSPKRHSPFSSPCHATAVRKISAMSTFVRSRISSNDSTPVVRQ